VLAKYRGSVSHPCCDTGPGPYSGPPDGLPAHLRHSPDAPRASIVQLRTSTRITPRIGAPDHHHDLPASTDTLRIRTTPYGATPTYYGLVPGPLRHMEQLRRTPDLVRTSRYIMAFTSDFRTACSAGQPSLAYSGPPLSSSGPPHGL
jgi:hypothetical protein